MCTRLTHSWRGVLPLIAGILVYIYSSLLRVQLSPGAARNGGSHLASAAGMDQTAS